MAELLAGRTFAEGALVAAAGKAEEGMAAADLVAVRTASAAESVARSAPWGELVAVLKAAVGQWALRGEELARSQGSPWRRDPDGGRRRPWTTWQRHARNLPVPQ